MNAHTYPRVECSVSCSAHSRCFSSRWWNRSKSNYSLIPVRTSICVLRKKKNLICIISYLAIKPDGGFYIHSQLAYGLISQFTHISTLCKKQTNKQKNLFGKFIFKVRVATWRYSSAAEHARGPGFHHQHHRNKQASEQKQPMAAS